MAVQGRIRKYFEIYVYLQCCLFIAALCYAAQQSISPQLKTELMNTTKCLDELWGGPYWKFWNV